MIVSLEPEYGSSVLNGGGNIAFHQNHKINSEQLIYKT